MWVRGLKLNFLLAQLLIMLSHPMWVRGLKRLENEIEPSLCKSHPMWVRGLKLVRLWMMLLNVTSHPMWVRGLKHYGSDVSFNLFQVAPYVGAWIETLYQAKNYHSKKVAPYVGAWIETLTMLLVLQSSYVSHPMWVRGLKRNHKNQLCFAESCRTLCGCVD